MSAFAAVLHDLRAAQAEPTARAMIDALAGPFDRTDTWDGGHVALGHGALNVTPEDLRERQPLATPEGQVVLAGDFRLDDREGLIRQLRGRDIGPTATDGQLVLAAYERWEMDAPAHLIGDFAFILWDGRTRRLFGARDALGSRPFYYHTPSGGSLLAASSVQQILSVWERRPRLREVAAAALLTAQTPELDRTFYEDIRQLPPAHALLVEPGRAARMWRYWDVDFATRLRYRDEDEYAEHLRDLLRRATADRLRTAFPVGILLSGGLDSGAAASFAGRIREQSGRSTPEIHALSHAFPSFPDSDERHVSDRIVEAFGFEPLVVDTDEVWPLQGTPTLYPDSPLVGAFQPVIEASLVRLREAGVRLVLSGHRGDLMAGEDVLDFPGLFWSGRWRRLRAELADLQMGYGTPWGWTLRRAFALPIRRTVWPEGRAENVRARVRRLRGLPHTGPAWVRDEWLRDVGLDESVARATRTLPLVGVGTARRRRYRIATLPLQTEVASWLVRVHASHATVPADPWSDRRIFEFVVSLPQWVLNGPAHPKRLTRTALQGVMPEAARQQAGKYIPGPLLDHALRVRERSTVETLLHDAQVVERGFVDGERLRSAYAAYVRGDVDLPLLWYTLALEMWLREFL